jgi:hypothetical protein
MTVLIDDTPVVGTPMLMAEARLRRIQRSRPPHNGWVTAVIGSSPRVRPRAP